MFSEKSSPGESPRVCEFLGTHNGTSDIVTNESALKTLEKSFKNSEEIGVKNDVAFLKEQINCFADIVVNNLIQNYYEH